MSGANAESRPTPLSALTDFIQYGYTAKSSSSAKGPRYLRITDIQDDHVEWTTVPRVSIASKDLARYRLESGDIVFARSGATVGKSFLIQGDPGNAVFASYLIRVRCTSGCLDPRYAALYFKSEDYWQQIRDGATGTGQPNFNGSKLGELRVPKRPLSEQLEMVQRLEALLKRSKNARDELVRIPRLVERYKEAILAAAFRGDLTAEWRRKNKPQELGGGLLGAMIAAHAKVIGQKSPHKRPDLDLTEAETLPPLPKTWTWIPVGLLASKVTDGVHKKPTYVDAGVPFLTVRNLTAGPGISFSECRYVTRADHNEFVRRTRPEYGDILISKDGTLGVVRAVRTKTVFSIFVSLALVKPVDRTMTDYLELAFGSPQVQQQMVGVGTGLQHIHLNDLRRDLIPIAPTGERAEIVLRVKTLFDAIDRLYAETTRATELLERLDRATLSKAFRGELP